MVSTISGEGNEYGSATLYWIHAELQHRKYFRRQAGYQHTEYYSAVDRLASGGVPSDRRETQPLRTFKVASQERAIEILGTHLRHSYTIFPRIDGLAHADATTAHWQFARTVCVSRLHVLRNSFTEKATLFSFLQTFTHIDALHFTKR